MENDTTLICGRAHAKKTKLKNGLAKVAKAPRQATSDRQQADGRLNPQDSRQALREQIKHYASKYRVQS